MHLITRVSNLFNWLKCNFLPKSTILNQEKDDEHGKNQSLYYTVLFKFWHAPRDIIYPFFHEHGLVETRFSFKTIPYPMRILSSNRDEWNWIKINIQMVTDRYGFWNRIPSAQKHDATATGGKFENISGNLINNNNKENAAARLWMEQQLCFQLISLISESSEPKKNRIERRRRKTKRKRYSSSFDLSVV